MQEYRSTILNVTVSEIEAFIWSFAEKGEFHLSANEMAQTFMKKYSDHDFEPEYIKYKDNHPEVDSIELYIVRFYFRFQCSLKDAYKAIKKSVNEQIKMFEERIKDLNNRISLTAPNEQYKRGKLIFFRDNNNRLLELARKDSEKKEIFRKAVSDCRCSHSLLFHAFDNKYFDYRQYEKFDIRRIINYGEAPVPIADRIHSLRNDSAQFSIAYRQYLDEYNIIKQIKNALVNTPILQDRINLFDIATSLFAQSNYEGFAYLMVPQIEGLFVVYCKLLGLTDIEDKFSITDKLKEAYEKENFFGYVYYCYDFPQIRNHIAHGSMISISEIDAYELLSDIYYIITQLILPLHSRRMIVDFLKDSLHFPCDYRLITGIITLDNLKDANINDFELEGINSYVEQYYVEQYEEMLICVTIRELPDGRSRCSTRTSGNISANDICAEHGGGGHFHAAVCELDEPPEEARVIMEETCRKYLTESSDRA